MEDGFNNSSDAKPITDSDGAIKKRDRSTIKFPYRDLDESVELVRVVHSKLGGSCTSDQLAPAAGYTSVSNGAFTQRLAAAGHYGFTVRDGDTIKISERGYRALEPITSKTALVESFLAVPLYSAVYERFKGQKLPEHAGLEKAMKDLGVTDATAAQARQIMMRAARQAGFLDFGEDRLTKPNVVQEQNGKGENSSGDPANTAGKMNQGGQETDLLKDMVTVNLVVHKSIVGYIEDLPKKGTVWNAVDFAEWTEAFLGALRYAYKVPKDSDPKTLVPGSSTNAPELPSGQSPISD